MSDCFSPLLMLPKTAETGQKPCYVAGVCFGEVRLLGESDSGFATVLTIEATIVELVVGKM